MKKETYENKLAELLGLTEQKQEIDAKKPKKEASKPQGKFHGIEEDEIQYLRQVQGIIYYLRAPELFRLKKCEHCGAEFLVSRLHVANCSYTCIGKQIEEEFGIKWSKGDDLEAVVATIYHGNEPLWIRNLPQLRKALETLVSATSPSK